MQSVQPVPHEVLTVLGWHFPLKQHRSRPQVPLPGPHAFVQLPPAQVGVPPPQEVQALPLLPHALLAVPGVQLAPSQQPSLQVRPLAQPGEQR